MHNQQAYLPEEGIISPAGLLSGIQPCTRNPTSVGFVRQIPEKKWGLSMGVGLIRSPVQEGLSRPGHAPESRAWKVHIIIALHLHLHNEYTYSTCGNEYILRFLHTRLALSKQGR